MLLLMVTAVTGGVLWTRTSDPRLVRAMLLLMVTAVTGGALWTRTSDPRLVRAMLFLMVTAVYRRCPMDSNQ